MHRSLTLAAALIACASLPALAAGPAVETEEQKTLYAIGVSIAQTLKPLTLTPAEIALVQRGLSDGLGAGPAAVDYLQYRAQVQQFTQARQAAAAEAEKKEAEVFLARLAREKGAEKTASGVILIPVTEGRGAAPKPTDTVKVHYTGTLRDATVFDSSVERGQPATFPLNRVIPCWTEGLQRMKVGGKAKLACPSSTAYGDRGAPPKIGGGAALLFEVELLGIETAPASPPAPPKAK